MKVGGKNFAVSFDGDNVIVNGVRVEVSEKGVTDVDDVLMRDRKRGLHAKNPTFDGEGDEIREKDVRDAILDDEKAGVEEDFLKSDGDGDAVMKYDGGIGNASEKGMEFDGDNFIQDYEEGASKKDVRDAILDDETSGVDDNFLKSDGDGDGDAVMKYDGGSGNASEKGMEFDGDNVIQDYDEGVSEKGVRDAILDDEKAGGDETFLKSDGHGDGDAVGSGYASEKGIEFDGIEFDLTKELEGNPSLNKGYEKTPLTVPTFAIASDGKTEFKVKICGESLESFALQVEKKKKKTGRERDLVACCKKRRKV